MSLDTGRRKSAARMLKRCEAMTLVRITRTGYDPETRQGTLVEDATTIHAKTTRYDRHLIGKGGIEAGDIQLTVAALEMGESAKVGDEVEMADGTRFQVQDCQAVKGYVEPILYLLQVRK